MNKENEETQNNIIEKEKTMLTPCKKGEDFDELKKLNEHLKLRKEELIKKGYI